MPESRTRWIRRLSIFGHIELLLLGVVVTVKGMENRDIALKDGVVCPSHTRWRAVPYVAIIRARMPWSWPSRL